MQLQWVVAIGYMLYTFSDSLIGIYLFMVPRYTWNPLRVVLVMGMYFGAQLMLALAINTNATPESSPIFVQRALVCGRRNDNINAKVTSVQAIELSHR